MKAVKKFFQDESGANAVEYGIIMALISVAIIAGASAIGTSLKGTFNYVANTLAGAVP